MRDLVEKLRKWAAFGYGYEATHDMRQAADEIERLRAALAWINQQRYTGRNTINPDNAFEHAIALNDKLISVMDAAIRALKEAT